MGNIIDRRYFFSVKESSEQLNTIIISVRPKKSTHNVLASKLAIKLREREMKNYYWWLIIII